MNGIGAWPKLVGMVAAAALGIVASVGSAVSVSAAPASAAAISSPSPQVQSRQSIAPIAGCTDVQDWDTLTKCAGGAESGLVTITKTITVPSTSTIRITKDITLTSAVVDGPTLTGAGEGGAFMLVQGGASLSIGTAVGDDSFIYRNGRRNFAYTAAGATFTVNGGTFDGIDISKDGTGGGTLVFNNGTAVINGGSFTNNTAWAGGVIRSEHGTLNITGGRFTGNVSKGYAYDGNSAPLMGGGVAYVNGGVLNVSGGTFSGNESQVGGAGGVFYLYSGVTATISGTSAKQTVFENNVQNPGECTRESFAPCSGPRSGGGVIYMEKNGAEASLTVRGNVRFTGNGEKSSAAYSGGGVIWVRGALAVKNGIDGSTPLFENNWAMIRKPSGQADEAIERGGAGGAIFLMMKSTATITGGRYADNTSGYLGGAIYTEENTVTYVGKTVAFENTAGHFGGGLWFCPSGNSTASKGGNIALFDNDVKPSLDANSSNLPTDDPAKNQVTYAGHDLAIMNPNFKSLGDNQFLLMNTWFTDRNNPAVTWNWDNTPLKESSGFADSWFKDQGRDAVLADTVTHHGEEQNPGLITLTRGNTPGAFQTGVAFKATVRGNAAEQQQLKDNAKKSAQITINGNRSRLSGGGFGSNGVVVFDTPYSMSWQKVDSSTDKKEPVKTSSTWTLSVSLPEGKTPYSDEDMRPTDCQVTGGDVSDDCWKKTGTPAAHGERTWTVDIVDNGQRDNDPDMGGISLDNLAPGVYTLVEKSAPNGFQKTENVYTFTIEAAVSNNSIPKEPNLEYAEGYPKKDAAGNPIDDNLFGEVTATENGRRIIGNKSVLGKLEWTKTDDQNTAITGSEWTLVGPNGKPTYNAISDCVDKDKCATDPGSDTNENPGKFTLDITDKDKFPDGEYTLTETRTPVGYWMPTNAEHKVTLGTDEAGNRTVKWAEGETGQIANTPTNVSWMKVDASDTTSLVGGAEWRITMIDSATATPADGKSWLIADCVPGSCDVPEGGLKDEDGKAGRFTVARLEPGVYTLVETKAPEGYVKSDATYYFRIDQSAPADNKAILLYSKFTAGDGGGTLSDPVRAGETDNAIINTKVLSALPFTGGRSARDWLILGGGLIIAAALAMAVMNREREKALTV
ncbi:prealbumin-like fold domain-containing protein [Bifidobacterium sp. UTCIF-38]|uniref:prealbumin-like fold domain-containing protein n=3 Tax=unclassified Bifidobacterium TaxID=2608897 RepID=UPI00112A9C6C|nr:prealbumin-like fold domain-containing protein [Bifidobacterium sp. UTCIF-38]